MVDPKPIEQAAKSEEKTTQGNIEQEEGKPSAMEVTPESADRSGSYEMIGSATEQSLRTTGSYDMVGMSQSRSQELGASQEEDWEKLDKKDWDN